MTSVQLKTDREEMERQVRQLETEVALLEGQWRELSAARKVGRESWQGEAGEAQHQAADEVAGEIEEILQRLRKRMLEIRQLLRTVQ